MRFSILSILFALTSFAFMSAQSSFNGTRLEEACVSYVQNVVNDNCEVEILQKIRDQVFAEKGVTASIVQVSKELRGISRIAVEYKLNDAVLRKIEIRLKVKLFKNVPAASVFLSKGTVIEDNMIEMKLKDVTDISPEDLIGNSEIISKTLKNGIAKGSVITKKDIGYGDVIKRGDKVKIIAESGAVRVAAMGTALTSAEEGETIRAKLDGYSSSVIQGTASMNGTIIIKSQKYSPNGR